MNTLKDIETIHPADYEKVEKWILTASYRDIKAFWNTITRKQWNLYVLMTNKLRDMEVSLMYATKNGDIQKVTEYLASGIDVNIRYRDQSTPLMHAMKNSQLEVAKLLIEKGADVNALDTYGKTALEQL